MANLLTQHLIGNQFSPLTVEAKNLEGNESAASLHLWRVLEVQNDFRCIILLNFHSNIKLTRAGLLAFILEDVFNKYLLGQGVVISPMPAYCLYCLPLNFDLKFLSHWAHEKLKRRPMVHFPLVSCENSGGLGSSIHWGGNSVHFSSFHRGLHVVTPPELLSA